MYQGSSSGFPANTDCVVKQCCFGTAPVSMNARGANRKRKFDITEINAPGFTLAERDCKRSGDAPLVSDLRCSKVEGNTSSSNIDDKLDPMETADMSKPLSTVVYTPHSLCAKRRYAQANCDDLPLNQLAGAIHSGQKQLGTAFKSVFTSLNTRVSTSHRQCIMSDMKSHYAPFQTAYIQRVLHRKGNCEKTMQWLRKVVPLVFRNDRLWHYVDSRTRIKGAGIWLLLYLSYAAHGQHIIEVQWQQHQAVDSSQEPTKHTTRCYIRRHQWQHHDNRVLGFVLTRVDDPRRGVRIPQALPFSRIESFGINGRYTCSLEMPRHMITFVVPCTKMIELIHCSQFDSMFSCCFEQSNTKAQLLKDVPVDTVPRNMWRKCLSGMAHVCKTWTQTHWQRLVNVCPLLCRYIVHETTRIVHHGMDHTMLYNKWYASVGRILSRCLPTIPVRIVPSGSINHRPRGTAFSSPLDSCYPVANVHQPLDKMHCQHKELPSPVSLLVLADVASGGPLRTSADFLTRREFKRRSRHLVTWSETAKTTVAQTDSPWLMYQNQVRKWLYMLPANEPSRQQAARRRLISCGAVNLQLVQLPVTVDAGAYFCLRGVVEAKHIGKVQFEVKVSSVFLKRCQLLLQTLQRYGLNSDLVGCISSYLFHDT